VFNEVAETSTIERRFASPDLAAPLAAARPDAA
jgi:hypothetical protein